MRRTIWCWLAVVMGLTSVGGRADVSLPPLFSAHAVLQRSAQVRIWGRAASGERVTISIAGQTETTAADAKGTWQVTLDLASVPGDGPFELVVTGRNRLVIPDILLGDVWICSGQSNMEYGIKGDLQAAESISQANQPTMRFFLIPKAVSPSPRSEMARPYEAENEGCWLVCSPETLALNRWKGFSAVGYYFGRELQTYTKKPLGLIGAYWGGTPSQAWVSLEALQHNGELKAYADQAGNHRQNFDRNVQAYREQVLPEWNRARDKWIAEHAEEWSDYQTRLKQWPIEAKRAESEGRIVPGYPKDPTGRKPADPVTDKQMPSVLYNGIIAPIIPYGIKGVIWYQGESNARRPVEYATLLRTLIEDWRSRWNQGDFPFLIVQLPKYLYRQPMPMEDDWAILRESQARMLELPNTGLAVTIDLGESADLHPKDKFNVGYRLALVARRIAYGDKVAAFGPTYKSMTVVKNQIHIAFDNVGGGLTTGVAPWPSGTNEPHAGQPKLRGFAIAGEDHQYVWADAEIRDNGVIVWSSLVPKPVSVRYAWAHNPGANLYNREGLPARPFRTDDYPVRETWD